MQRQFFGSLLTVTTVLTSVLPAHANPLDTYKGSILDPSSSTLSADPRALCSDIVAQNTSEQKSASDVESRYKDALSYMNKAAQTNSNNNEEKMSGGGSFMGIGANFSKEEKNSNSSSSNNESRSDSSEEGANVNKASNETKTSTAVAAGRNCDAFVKASSERDAAAYTAGAQVRMTEIATEGKVEAIKTQMNGQFMQKLLDW